MQCIKEPQKAARNFHNLQNRLEMSWSNMHYEAELIQWQSSTCVSVITRHKGNYVLCEKAMLFFLYVVFKLLFGRFQSGDTIILAKKIWKHLFVCRYGKLAGLYIFAKREGMKIKRMLLMILTKSNWFDKSWRCISPGDEVYQHW